MFGSVVGIFMEVILQDLKPIQPDQQAVPTVCYVAAAGTSMPAIALFRVGAAIVLLTAVTSLASVFVGIPLINFCFCTGGHCSLYRRTPFRRSWYRRTLFRLTWYRRTLFRLIYSALQRAPVQKNLRRYSERRYIKFFGATASAGTNKNGKQ